MNTQLAWPKPEPRARIKARKDRAEAKVIKAVRAACVVRDGRCRVASGRWTDHLVEWFFYECAGVSEWAHMHQKRRSQTRNQPPEIRHTTKDSLMLCTQHHAQYDNKATPRLFISALTRKGADGPMKFTRAKA